MIRIEFDSLSELARAADKAPKDGASWKEENQHGKHSWTYGVGRDKAVRMAKHGWPEGAAKAKRLLDDADLPPIEDTHSATRHDVTGSYVDVGEYVQGVPECMVDFIEDKRTARFVHIIVSGCFSAGFSGDQIMNRGVCIASVVDALEARGVRCSVELLTKQDRTFETSVMLKRTTDALNLDVLTYAVAHPATFRRLIFGVCDAQPMEIRQKHGFQDGYGYGLPVPVVDDTALVFPTMVLGKEKWDKTTAEKLVKQALEKYATSK